jgi:hypothetical protein
MGGPTKVGPLRHAGRAWAEVKFAPKSISPDDSNEFAERGFEIIPNVLPAEQCDSLAGQLTALHETKKSASKGKLGGLRNLIQLVPDISDLASSQSLCQLLESRLGQTVFPVRAIFFDKTPDANWLVPWHQDLTIAVVEKIETTGFEAWSRKEGIVHVQPPCEVLQGMATLRLHLDNCESHNGPLKIVPRSHRCGKLRSKDISTVENERDAFLCELKKGGAVLMSPLVLHASSPAKNPSHRRVLHIEYATGELPDGLKWFDRR